nr:unnamed protein product [Callosobruchus chinensis]
MESFLSNKFSLTPNSDQIFEMSARGGCQEPGKKETVPIIRRLPSASRNETNNIVIKSKDSSCSSNRSPGHSQVVESTSTLCQLLCYPAIDNNQYFSEFLPFPPIIVKDTRHDDFMKNMENFVPPSKIIGCSHVGSSNSSYKQWVETCVKLANSPLRAVTHSVASSPHSSAFDEYDFTTEEEDRLLKGSEECVVGDETTSEASWPKANQQASNLSAVQEPSVTEVFKSKDSILKSDNNEKNESIKAKNVNSGRVSALQETAEMGLLYEPVPVCLRLEDCGYETESSINDLYKMIANNPDAIKNLKVTCTDKRRTFESVSIPPASFKIPSLRPAKRPPSRPKKSRTNSTGSRERITDSRTNKLRTSLPSEDVIQDDTISIIACDPDVGNLNDLHQSSDTEVTVEAEDESLLGENRPFIENWVENVNSAATSDRNTPTDCGGFRLEQRQADNVALPKTTKYNSEFLIPLLALLTIRIRKL